MSNEHNDIIQQNLYEKAIEQGMAEEEAVRYAERAMESLPEIPQTDEPDVDDLND